MKTLEQRRMAHALGRVENLQDRSSEFKKLYRAYVDRLGPAVVMNGLGQALATVRAAAGAGQVKTGDDRAGAYRALYDGIRGWLCRDGGVYPPGGDPLEAIAKHDQSYYLRAQAEALAWLEWHKKCCRAAFPSSIPADPDHPDAEEGGTG